jgi:general L-amino acid transport system substrate-binding protein
MNLVAFEKADEVVAAYDAGRCDVYTTDRSGLYAQRTKLTNPSAITSYLPEIISKEPLGPVVRQGDDQWFNIGRNGHLMQW